MSYRSYIKSIQVIVLGFFIVLLVGCASPARYTEMTVQRNEITPPSKNSALLNNIAIKDISGGKKTNPLWTSQVSDGEFSQALRDSLSNVGYLNSDLNKSRFRLVVNLEKLQQPMFGFDFTVVCKTKYKLYDEKLKKEVFDKTLTTPYTANFDSAFIGTTRLKLANEGAVKENIKQFLQDLTALKI